jgi:DNA-binding XRE family transcriptional regulator
LRKSAFYIIDLLTSISEPKTRTQSTSGKNVKIISGGQTGVDRAALDVALELGMECGGWCPKGRLAEDGAIPARYPLQETAQAGYRKRTSLNILEAHGTLLLNMGRVTGGTGLTMRLIQQLGEDGSQRAEAYPCLLVQLDRETISGSSIQEWISRNGIEVLNVAGPKESKRPGVYGLAREILLDVFLGKANRMAQRVKLPEEKRTYSIEEVFPEMGSGDALRGARGLREMTQANLAAAVGVRPSHISDMENNRRPIGKEMAKKLGKSLDIPWKVFL